MINTKLILIEGMIGSGKTTTAENLAIEINRNGKKATWYHENAPEHPLNTSFSQLLQKNYGKTFDLTPIITKTRRNDPSVDSLHLWKKLAVQSAPYEEIAIIESRFWQHETMYRFLLDFELEQVLDRQKQITEIISACRPVLVYLANDDPALVIENAFRTRPIEWQQWVLWLFEEHPYFKTRKLTQTDGFVEFFRAWNRVADELYRQFPCSKIMIRNPHENWKRSTDRLFQALEL